MKYATYDARGNVTGHYSDDIHAKIPQGAAPMTDKEWALSCQGQLTRDTAKGKWATKSGPTATELMDEAKAGKRREVNSARSRVVNGGLSHGGYAWDTDEASRANLNGVVAAITAGIPLPEGFTWRTADNQDVAMQAADLIALAGAMFEHVNICYQRSWQRKAAIDAAATAAEVAAVSW